MPGTPKKTRETFISEVAKANPNTEIIGAYQNTKTKVRCRCRKCGYEWDAWPGNLVRGHGCPKCAGKWRMTDKEFRQELQEATKSIIGSQFQSLSKKAHFKCKVCGYEWDQVASAVLKKPRCPKCSKTRRKITTEEFKEELQKALPSVVVLGEYQNRNTKILVRCNVCGYKWEARPDQLLRRHGCPHCAGNARVTQEEFENRLAAMERDVELVDEYRSLSSRALFRCKKHDCLWVTTPQKVLDGVGCEICRREKLSNQRSIYVARFRENINGTAQDHERPHSATNTRLTKNDFAEKLASLGTNIELVGEYKGLSHSTLFRCKKHDCTWQTTPRNILKGAGCEYCRREKISIRRSMTTDWFKEELAKVNPNVEVIGKYTKMKDAIRCRCLVCGEEWEPRAEKVIQGQGCPQCSHRHTSYCEQFIVAALRLRLGENSVLNRDKSAVAMELDVYLPEYALAIEIGSWVWHHDKLDRDAEKRMKCRDAGIRLITIYDSYDANKEPDGEYITVPFNLGEKTHEPDLVRLTNWLLSLCGINSALNEKEIAHIVRTAHQRARRKTTEEFRAEMLEKQPDIEVLGEYKRSDQPIECRCLRCGHVWKATPEHLSAGRGCPACSRKRPRKSQQEFENSLNGSLFELAGSFAGVAEKTTFRCKKCGGRFQALPSKIKGRRRCPLCGERNEQAQDKKMQDQRAAFIAALPSRINKDVELLGEYKNMKTKITCRCKKCGHVWQAEPTNLIYQKGGCPVCAREAGRLRSSKFPICLETGEHFTTCAEAEKSLELPKGSVSACCRGDRKQVHGYHFEYSK